MKTRFIQSFSINCTEKLISFIMPNDRDGTVKKYAKLAAGTTSFAFGILAALIETTARAAFALLIKVFTIFIPAGTFDPADDLVKFFAKSVVINAWGCVQYGYAVTGVFLEKARVKRAANAIQATFNHPNLKSAIKSFSTLHINGFPEKEPPLSPLALAMSTKDVLAPSSSELWQTQLLTYWG